jgi:tRNA pseudouridine38-40 synthase
MKWRAAVKLAYDGRDFYGSQRQPEVPTVEDEVIRCLRKIEAIEGAKEARFRTASRTDRGVSALGNVVAFDTSFSKRSLLRALNSASESVYYYAWADVPASFSPRRASARWYRYFLPAEGLDVEMVSNCAELFQGRHDFRRFCKEDKRSTVKTLDKVGVIPLGEFLVIDLEGREFLRNMVRRVVAALQQVGRGRSSLDEVMRALEGENAQFGLVPPENLCLMEVRYPIDFKAEAPPTLRGKVRKGSQDSFVRLAFFDNLSSRFEGEDGRL